MTPLFFGSSDKPLFGAYHPPKSKSIRNAGVLLCYPAVQEYMRIHWAYRRLANLLSQNGFHVFRFDYFATGDSSGESSESNIEQWKADIYAAANELKDIAVINNISIVGVRLGAALAAKTVEEGLKVKDLILWDPVVSGQVHIQEMMSMHKAIFPTFKVHHEYLGQLLGYPFSLKMCEDLSKINMLESVSFSAERIFLVISEERKEYFQLSERLDRLSANFDCRHIIDACEWENLENFDNAMIISDILNEIVSVLSN
jgi:uncharacterized protein